MKTLKLILRLTRPQFLVGVAILYALGGGIAHYLGNPLDWAAYVLGQIWVTLLQMSTQFLNEYFNSPADQANPNRTWLTGGSGALGAEGLPRRVALMAALTCLAVLASMTVVLISTVAPPLEAYLVMLLAFLGAFFYSTPPVKLESSGYGELTTAVLITFLVPAYAFLLQTGELHRLLAMTGFPLSALFLAMLLAFELPDYSNDVRFEKRTLMVRLGWQTGMGMHNLLIFSAFLILLLASWFGFPWFATLAGLLPMPLGLFQIWQMRLIANGAPPNWNLLTLSALALFGAQAYLLAYAFWTH
jgi:1,4-dihydroxy-2-naphthoate octaprenyltransferase